MILHRTSVVGISDIDLITADVIEGAPMSVRMLSTLKHGHYI